MPSQHRIIIIRQAAESPALSAEQQAFMQDLIAAIEAGNEIDRQTRMHALQLLGLALFGSP